ncbi:MAG: hypothetical protein L0Y68_02125, partial [Candidatus Dadabacteria bacterium]|nr:hypothetical protein [Candidatus Dadabacteria bacterium]
APRDWLCHDWSNVNERYLGWKNSEDSQAVAEEIFKYTRDLVKDCDTAFIRLQPNLKIQACLKESEEVHIPGE